MVQTKAAKKRGKKSKKVRYFLYENGKDVPQEAPNLEEFVKLARENKWLVDDNRQKIFWLPHVSTVPIPRGMQHLRGSDWARVRVCTGEEIYYERLKAEEEARNRWYAEAAGKSTPAAGKSTPPVEVPWEDKTAGTSSGTADPQEHLQRQTEDSEGALPKDEHEHETAGTGSGTEHSADPQEDLQRQTESSVVQEGPLAKALVMKLDERELTESDPTFQKIVMGGRTVDFYEFLKGLQQGMKEMNTNMTKGLSRLETKIVTGLSGLKTDLTGLETKMDKGFTRLHEDMSHMNEVTGRLYIQRWIVSVYGRKCEVPISIKLSYTKDDRLEQLAARCLKNNNKLRSSPDEAEIDAYAEVKVWTGIPSEVFVGEISHSPNLEVVSYQHPEAAINNSSSKLLFKFIRVERGLRACKVAGKVVFGAAITSRSFKYLDQPQSKLLIAAVLSVAPELSEICSLGDRFHLIG